MPSLVGKLCIYLFDSVSSGSDSASDDSGKSADNPEISNGSRNLDTGEDILAAAADSDDSSAGEDDFNPFGNSGSEDEGNTAVALCIYIACCECIGLTGSHVVVCVL